MKSVTLAFSFAALTTLAAAPAFAGDPGPGSPAGCTAKSGCPSTYEQVFPLLDRFCAGDFSDEDLTAVDGMITTEALAKDAVEALFNVYGAGYGYEFKQLKQLNAFFYAKDAAKWLPASCVPFIKAKAKASEMPFALTQKRDALRRIFDEHFKNK